MADRIAASGAAIGLEEKLQEAAAEVGARPLQGSDLRHLVRILTSHALVATSVDDLIQFTDQLDAYFYPNALRSLAAGEADEDLVHRVVAVPDHVRFLGDKCLFEAGVARRRGPKGIDLAELGRRSYQRASQVLGVLSQDARLRGYYDQNALDAVGIADEVEFLSHCADHFGVHVRLLNALLKHDQHSIIAARPGPAPEATTTGAAAKSDDTGPKAGDAGAKAKSAALAPRRRTRFDKAPGTGPDESATPPADTDDGPKRIHDLHLVGRSDEEVADQRLRDLIVAEKTILFSSLDTERLRDELKKVVIHQDQAIDSLCDELALYSTGTQDPRKPPSYFLVGPTGVGKNYLVECLLRLFEQLWGIEVPYLELSGPEFTYPSDINELKGAARGFIRSDEEGIMTQFHKRAHDKPFSVVLVDEVEKAHPQLRRFFLPIMDRGTMMDNRGKVLHFVNSMIFFTSNVGYSDASRSTQPIGYGDETSRDRAVQSFVEGRIRKTLSPEFINRVHIIHFEHLTRAAVDDIFDLELAKIRRRYRTAQRLEILVTDGARAELIRRGYNHDYGARNLAKVMNRFANIEISKALKRDEARQHSDVSQALSFVREMREGKRPLDLEEVQAAVEECARVRVPYSRITIDVESGEFVYRRG